MKNRKNQLPKLIARSTILFLLTGTLSCMKVIEEKSEQEITSTKSTAKIAIQTKVKITDFGAIGDGKSDNYQAFLDAAAYANTHSNIKIYFPAGVYYIAKYHTKEAGKSVKDIIFTNCEGLTLYGNNDAVISVNGSFYRKFDRSTPSGRTKQSTTSGIIPFYFTNCNNLTVKGLEINGNVDKTTRDQVVTESASSLIKVVTCYNIQFQNLYLHHSQTDGMIFSGKLSENNSSFTPCENVTVVNVKSYNNARQGMSIGGMKNGYFKNCEFKYTGVTGKYGYHEPAAGVDIEPDEPPRFVRNVKFEKCVFEENIGGQFIATRPSTTSDVTLLNCRVGKTTPKTSSIQGVTMLIKNGIIDGCYCDLGSRNIGTMSRTLPGSTITVKNSYIKSTLNGIGTVASTNREDSLLVINNKLEFGASTMPGSATFFPYLIAKNVQFLNNQVLINATAVKSRGINSVIQNAIISKGNKFYSENLNIKPKVSYKNTRLIQDL